MRTILPSDFFRKTCHHQKPPPRRGRLLLFKGFSCKDLLNLHKTRYHVIIRNSLNIAIIKGFGGPAQTRTEIPIFGGVDSIQLSYRATKQRRRFTSPPDGPFTRLVSS
jgi:hypothetical protein